MTCRMKLNLLREAGLTSLRRAGGVGFATIHTVAPGLIDTDDCGGRATLLLIPLGRLERAGESARVVDFLAGRIGATV